MKGKSLGVILAALAAVIVLAVVAAFAMGGNSKPNNDTEKEPNKNTEQSTEDELKTVELTDKALEGDFLLDFSKGPDSSVVFESDGWSNGDVFNVVWKKHNVKYADGKMYLGITKEKATAWLNNEEVAFPYTAGEARTQNYFGYGDYFVKMKPSKNPGTASTFFTCTGPYDTKYVLDENGKAKLNEDGTIMMTENPHDEIDIEFLGNDTTKVQFNFFVNGKGGNEYMYELGYDAAEEFHEYGFRWTEDSITWFIDGKPVYKVTTDKTVEEAENLKIVDVLPSTPGRLLMNYWCGNEGAELWMGKYEGNVNDNGCEYEWIKSSTKGAPLNPENVDLSAAENCLIINGENYLFTTDGNYTFDALNNNKALNITYTNVIGASYKNIATGLADLPSKYNKLTMKVKNNGKETVKIRIDVGSQTQVSKNTKACNVYATQDGTEVFTDTDWGGSKFEIAAGATSTLEVYFDPAMKTEALIIYIDTADHNEDGLNVKHSGSVTFSNVAFSTGKVPVAQAPVVPDVDVDTSTLDRVEADLTYQSTPEYTVTKDNENKTWNVTYTNVQGGATGNGYKTISAGVETLDLGLNRYSVKIRNNGTEAVKVRIDIIGKTPMGTCPDGKPLNACNLASLQDGVVVEGGTDTVWGGSAFTIEPGKTSVLEVVFKAEQVVSAVEFFFDSHIYDDNETHAGDVTLSEMAFLGELEGEVDGPIQTPGYGDDAPEHPVSGNLTTSIDGTNISITGTTTEGYGVNASVDENNNQIIDVVYTNIIGKSYATVEMGGIEELAAVHDTFNVTITNNGAEAVKIRIDVADKNNKICNVSAIETAVRAVTDKNNGTQIELAAGAEAIIEIKYDPAKQPTKLVFFIDSWIWDDPTPHAGNITLSGMTFSGTYVPEEDDDQDEPVVTYDKLKYEWHPDTSALTSSVATWGEEFESVTVGYVGEGPDWSSNIVYRPAVDVAGKHTFSLDVENKSEEAVKVRIGLKDANEALINVSQTAEGGTATTEDGYSVVTVNPGETARLTIEASADIAKILVFPGNAGKPAEDWDGPVDAEVVLSNFKFEGEPEPEPTVTYDKLKYEWHPDTSALTSSVATWGEEFESVTVGYVGEGPDWSSNIVYRPAVDVAGKHTFSLDVENKSEEAVKVRIGLKDANEALINVSQTAEGGTATTEDGYSVVTVNPGETARLTIEASADIAKILVFPGNAGKPAEDWDGPVDAEVVLSNFKFD